VRAFHNVCRHRGNKLVWSDFPARRDVRRGSSVRCNTTAGATTLNGACTFVQQEGEFFDLDKDGLRPRPVHCDVWAGFVFVNLDGPAPVAARVPRPMVTALEGYPFDR
jgi:phenylpropionate dioxygenase-like ring-hydroxylating dioxygenase large terminal subunit